MTEIICSWNKAWNGILGRNSSLVFPSKDTPKRPPYIALQWHWEDECIDFKYPNTCNTCSTVEFEVWWMIIQLYHTHFNYRIITPCCLIGTELHLGDCEIAVIVSLFTRLILCWKTPQNTGNSLSELQEIKHFLVGMPVDSVVSES
jgi:hypothetical protein